MTKTTQITWLHYLLPYIQIKFGENRLTPVVALRFPQTLEERCLGTKTLFVLNGESYTSKKCEICKAINHQLGSSKIFNCMNCGHTTDRMAMGPGTFFVKRYFRSSIIKNGSVLGPASRYLGLGV